MTSELPICHKAIQEVIQHPRITGENAQAANPRFKEKALLTYGRD